MFTRSILVAAAFGLATFGSSVHGNAPTAADEGAIIHAVSRLTFGVRPGDVAKVKTEGLSAWIDRQLNPARIDDAAMAGRLARLSTLGLDSESIARDIHAPARRERQQRMRNNAASPQDPAMTPDATQPRRPGGGPGMLSETAQRDRQIVTDLSEAKILRAVYSERQLEEVLVDFWFNHFNVFAGKGPTRVWLGEFEREAIRPHVLGSFRTMLEAVAKSPAMLFYLDNWMNVDPEAGNRQPSAFARQPRAELRRDRAGSARSPNPNRALAGQALQRPLARRATGLNENYARELMELHTLGVDGGYTQQDVVNVARAFTGWTLDAPRQGGFRFDPRLHDTGEKIVLGRTIKAGGGIEDGLGVLDILATHPATARFVAEKLARRFVSDEPPADLVTRAAAKFSSTRGDLRETLRVIITSPEFLAPAARSAKVKTPLEFVVSALRATGADVTTAMPIVRELRELGMPLYLCQPPTGYDDTAATWVSSGALVGRMNFALALGANRLRGITVPFDSTAQVSTVRATLLNDALGGTASAGTRSTIEKATTVEQTLALTLGSPEFQKK